MDWSPLDVATDGMFCDAFGMATDGYFCAPRRVLGVVGPEHVGLDREQRDRRDIADVLSILMDGLML